jgi:Endonuclease/Exonuclease/phosphatase family
MLSIRRTIASIAVAALALSAAPGGVVAKSDDKRDNNRRVRFATFNASLNRGTAGQLIQDLSTPNNAQAKTIAEIIQRNRPDVLLINEFDFDANHEALRLFQDNYLSVEQNGARSIDYEYAYTAPSNTGIPSGFDLNNDGTVGGPDDAFGFGFFPGQFGMAVYSRHPIDFEGIRTFQNFLWADMPGASLPDDPMTPAPNDWFSPEELEVVRLSSKSHWDIPVEIGRRTVHVLAAHPTPPVFDGPEDRNGKRNFDEIGFWSDYVSPSRGEYIYDDEGQAGGLAAGEPYVIMGDYNSDPNDGDSVPGAIQQILDLPGLRTDPTPSSPGAREQSELQGGINDSHISNPAFDTADFAEPPGNLRVDYVLPSRPLNLVDAEVFWPRQRNRHFPLVGVFPFPSSDHRLVWAEVKVPGSGR